MSNSRGMTSGPERGAGRDLAALVRLLPSAGGLQLAVGLVLVVAGSALAVGFTLASGRAVADLVALAGQELDSAAGRRFTGSVVLVAGVYLGQQLIQQLSMVHGGVLTRRVDGALRERAMNAVLSPATTEVLQRPEVKAGADRARELAPAGFTPGQAAAGVKLQLRQHLDAVAAAVTLVVLGQWPLVAMLVVIRAVGQWQGLLMFWENLRVVAGGGSQQRRSSYFRDLALTAPAAKELRIFGLADWVARRNRAASLDVLAEATAGRGGIMRSLAMALAETGNLVLAGGWLGWQALDGSIDAGTLATGLLLAGTVGHFNLDDSILAVSYGAAAVPAILELERAVAEPGAATTATMRDRTGPPTVSAAIRIEGLTYRYPGSERAVLDRLDLTIPAGQRLAVVGLNGAGKTTLVKLLCGLLQPSEGRIVVDGVDLADVDPWAWRTRVAALFQHFVRYELSVRDNVALGAVDVDMADDDLDALVRRVGMPDLHDRLPEGWDTTLSPQRTGGTDLSGGQWQRIALARALRAVEGGARLLFLDEPTANLDVRAEADLYERFLELTGSAHDGAPLTTVLISHRFSTVRQADRIVVIDGGVVTEDGDHASLMATGGTYARLFELQASRFADGDDGEAGGADPEVVGAGA